MKKILIFGVLALMVTVSFAGVMGDDKQIDINTFSIGDKYNYVNVTSSQVVIDDSLENNSANLFIHNNASYDLVSFKVKGGPNLDGTYPSNVAIDLGDNGRDEYRFGGSGAGSWGQQYYIADEAKNPKTQYDVYPSQEGKLVYLKLPSNAVVTSATVNLSHDDAPVTKTGRLSNSNSNWARSYWYHSTSYGYGYYYPKSNIGSSYVLYYPYPYYYAASNAYLSWDLNDPNLAVPPGAEVTSYDLYWMVRNYAYRNYLSGQSGNYHYGERTYGAYPVTGSWPTSYTSMPTTYGTTSEQKEAFEDYNPSFQSEAAGRYFMEEYFGNTNYIYNYDVHFDLSDLLVDWQDGTLSNNGIMVCMDETPYASGYWQRNGYSSSSSSPGYRYYYYRGYMYSPTSTSSYRPYLKIEYKSNSESPWLDVADDGNNEWSYDGLYIGSQVLSGWQATVNQYLRSHFPDEVDVYGNEWTYVPIRVGADSAGSITMSDIQVNYDYTASVLYNPVTDTLANELQSLVPSTESGHRLVNIMTTSNTPGILEFSDLQLVGEKPNYRPSAMEISNIDVPEGAQNDMLVPLSDYFMDIDQEPETLQYEVVMNSQAEHVDLFINTVDETRDVTVYLGIDTSKDENWFGEVDVQVMAMDDLGKSVYSNVFTLNIESVNDIPYTGMEIPDLYLTEGVDPIVLEYNAPSGRSVARGKDVVKIDRSGAPYFMDIEGEDILMDFELLSPDMEPVPLEWDNGEGYKIFNAENNEAYLTVLPPEYTEDPDNYILLFGTDPDFTTTESGPYHLKVYASDDMGEMHEQMNTTFEIYVLPINDAPVIQPIPDVVMDEDSIFTSPTPFLAEYVKDIDDELEDLEVAFYPASDSVHLSLDGTGKLVVELDMDFNGVVPVAMEVTDGVNTEVRSFNIRIRSINDPPVLVIDNLYEDQIISELYRVKGSADDIEKELRNIEVAVIKVGDILYTDDWIKADGAYVWQYLLDIRNFEEGWHTIYIRGFDGRDFSELHEFNVYFKPPEPPLPPPPPVLTIDTVLTGEQSDNIEVSGTVSDGSGYVSFVEYRIDGSIWRKAVLLTGSQWKVTIDTNILTNDEHNLSVRAYNGKTYSDIVFQKFDVMNKDSDGDGINNDVEVSLLMDPFNELDGTMDFDGDGFSNYQELKDNFDPFDGTSHPEKESDKEDLIDLWALIFMVAAIICAVLIIGLFILNIRLERNIHKWREDLSSKRVERKPKTLLQKIVEIAPTFAGINVDQGPSLPGTPPQDQAAALPPGQEEGNPPIQ